MKHKYHKLTMVLTVLCFAMTLVLFLNWIKVL